MGERIDANVWRPQTGFQHRIAAAEQLDALNATGGIAVHFAMPLHAIDLTFDGSQSETLSVWKTSSNSGFTTTPKLSARLVTLRFVDMGALVRIDQNGTDHVVGVGQALLTSFDVMRREQATPRFSAISTTVSVAGILEASRSLFGRDTSVAPLFETTVDVNSQGLRAVRATVEALRGAMSTKSNEADFITPLMEEVLLYQLLGSWPLTGEPHRGHAFGTTDSALSRSVDFIEGNLQRQIAVRDIAAAAGVSVRGLQSAFKRDLGRGPIQYLIERRLDRVHAELRSRSGEQVRVIAQRWGFVHMSDFARRYRGRYGRTPSEDAGA